MNRDLSPGKLAHIACVMEVQARKPGNVHRFADFDDLDHLDFLLAAAAVAEPLDRAASVGVGRAVLEAVEATRRVVATNANLGIILLLAPMAAAPMDVELAAGLPRVLDALTVDDARHVYRAIRLANPGGLGRADAQDVADEPTVTLRQAMALAADRDLIARQYADGFPLVLGEGLPILRRHLNAGRALEPAIVATHVELLANHPDSLIARKLGLEVAREASRRARRALDAGLTPAALAALDAWLRADGRRRNPGTTADLVAAVLFAALREGAIPLPRPVGPAAWTGEPSWIPARSPSSKDQAMPAASYKVRVAKDELVFSSGHFITFDGDTCERIHGHNYRVAVEVDGPLDENGYVVDFIALRDMTRALVLELDHRMLLPGESPLIRVAAEGPNTVARFGDRFWSFPSDECVVLPVPNTTAELLARLLGERLLSAMKARGWPDPDALRVEVEECFGQSAEVRLIP